MYAWQLQDGQVWVNGSVMEHKLESHPLSTMQTPTSLPSTSLHTIATILPALALIIGTECVYRGGEIIQYGYNVLKY